MIENKTVSTKLKIGPYDIIPIPTGSFGLDGGAMFGTVPKILWERSNPADEKNRIQMEARALLLRSKDQNILIDTGNGQHFIEKYGAKLGGKFAEMYNIDPEGPSLLNSLKKNGLSPEDIDIVILTHLHFDHAGGATSYKDGKVVPSFPNAKYYVQRANLETAAQPNLRERASYFSCNSQPLIDTGVLQILEGETMNIIEGISVLISNGHTLGQQLVKINDEQNTLLYCADLIPTASHVRIAWIMGYDLNPILIMSEKQVLLEMAANENWYLFFEHDPYCDCAQVEKNGADFAVKQKYFLSP